MKRLLTIPVLLLATAAPVTAQDADGDGVVTLEEFQAAYPALTSETFVTLDTDEDGVLSEDEMAAAREEGLLPE